MLETDFQLQELGLDFQLAAGQALDFQEGTAGGNLVDDRLVGGFLEFGEFLALAEFLK